MAWLGEAGGARHGPVGHGAAGQAWWVTTKRHAARGDDDMTDEKTKTGKRYRVLEKGPKCHAVVDTTRVDPDSELYVEVDNFKTARLARAYAKDKEG